MAVKMKAFTSGLQAAAALILLSATAESLQCYWCGPLAEQVHRSQRAPPCDNVGDHVTACDPGYTHCAVVASSPPFAESRYCVKFYQDECYTLYCNSTKTYRMTCPCRGELCNGPNTQREIDAFAVLAKAVSKTQNIRIKKRNAIFSNNVIKSKDKIAHLIQNEEEDEPINNTKSDMDSIEIAVDNEITEHIQVSNFSNDAMQSDQPQESSNEHSATPSKHEEMNDETDETKVTTKGDNEIGKEVPEMSTPRSAEIVNANPEMMDTKTSALPMIPQTTVVEENSIISHDIKPSMELPTAEALQQNSDPLMSSEKPMEQTTTETSHMTTTESTGSTTPKSTKPTRNSAESVFLGTSLILFKSLIINKIL